MSKAVFKYLLPFALAVALFSNPAHALKFHLSEPSSHPDKIDVTTNPPVTSGTTAGVNPANVGAAGSVPASDTGTGNTTAPRGRALGDGKYNGIFSAWQPLDNTLPLKSAQIELGVISHRQHRQMRNILSRSVFTGNYYLEGVESNTIIDKLGWKTQLHRQLKGKPVTNSLISINGEQSGLTFKYDEKEKLTSLAAPKTGGNHTRNRTLSVDYKHSDALTFKLKSDSRLHHTMGGTPTNTTSEKYDWSAGYLFAENSQLLLTHTDNTSRNRINNKTSRNIGTGVTLTMPLAGIFGVRLGYKHNDNFLNSSGTGTSHNSRTASLAVICQLQEDSQLTWTISHSNLKSMSGTSTLDYDVAGQEINLHYVLSKALTLNTKNILKDDDANGKYTHNQAVLVLDHSHFRILPGKTTFTTKKTINRAGSGAHKTVAENNTINLPLSYLNGRLKARAQLNFSRNSRLSAVSSNDTSANNHNYRVTYNILRNLKAKLEAKSMEQTAFSGDGLASMKSNNVYSEKLSYELKTPLAGIPAVTAFKYDLKTSRSRNRTFAPRNAFSISKITSNIGTLSFADGNYSGSYQFEHSNSRQPHGIAFRALKHRLKINIADFVGFKLTSDYTAVFQTKGFSNNGILKLSQVLDNNNVFSLAWEFSRNQDKNNLTGNRKSEYLEATMELNF